MKFRVKEYQHGTLVPFFVPEYFNEKEQKWKICDNPKNELGAYSTKEAAVAVIMEYYDKNAPYEGSVVWEAEW
jgi:hypothetical protein